MCDTDAYVGATNIQVSFQHTTEKTNEITGTSSQEEF